MKLAIELNGPCHYVNMYGDLEKVQKRDSIKAAEILQKGYKLVAINTIKPILESHAP